MKLGELRWSLAVFRVGFVVISSRQKPTLYRCFIVHRNGILRDSHGISSGHTFELTVTTSQYSSKSLDGYGMVPIDRSYCS